MQVPFIIYTPEGVEKNAYLIEEGNEDKVTLSHIITCIVDVYELDNLDWISFPNFHGVDILQTVGEYKRHMVHHSPATQVRAYLDALNICLTNTKEK